MSLAYDSERRYVNLDGAPVHEDTLPEDMSDADYGEWFGRSFVPGGVGCRVGPPVQRVVPAERLDSAITCLREIAAMGKKAGSERATQWLLQHGYPLEEGGYVPGKGFVDSHPPVTVRGEPMACRQLEADVPALDADARRWRYARQFLTIDDVEGWQSDNWAGHVPSGLESERADAAVDEALSRNA